MSLIEQAAKRLEELRRAGIDVSEKPGESRAPQAPPVSRQTAAPGAQAQPSPLAIAQNRDVSRPGESRRVSRTVRIDLARLGKLGYVTPEAPRSRVASEFRVIKRPLLANAQTKSGSGSKNTNLVMVTSALAGEGKSFTALNLAMSVAMELDTTVLLVDADVSNSSLLPILGLPQAKGLLDVLTDDSLDLSKVILRTNVPKLALLPAGTPHSRATELLASETMTRLVAQMATRYPDRVIVFDSPPLLLTTESRVLAAHMGQILVVVEADKTTAGALKQALDTVESCPIVMTMLNKTTASDMASYYGYGYRYSPSSGEPTG